MFKQIATRTVTAMLLIAVLLSILFIGIHAVNVALLLLSCFMVYEFSALSGFKNHLVINIFAMLYTIGMLLSVITGAYWVIPVIVFAFIFVLFLTTVLDFGNTTFSYISQLFAMCSYIAITLSSLQLIYTTFDYGYAMVFLVFIASFITDTGAYFVGIFFGKHKLIEKVSPKKTIEGSMGGTIFCVLGFIIFALITGFSFKIEYSYIKLIILALVASAVSQVGDLACSAIKREYNVKDFAKTFPGHGGFLDRVDSMIAVAPVIYMYLEFIGILN